MVGKTLTFYAAAIKAGKLPPVSNVSQLKANTPNVILLGKSVETVSQ
jgi:hypothetical protein